MIEHIAKMEIEPGVCPMCGKTLVEGDQEDQGGTHRWTDVSCPNCDWEGRQWDRVEFVGYQSYDRNKNEMVNLKPSEDPPGTSTEVDAAMLRCKRLDMDLRREGRCPKCNKVVSREWPHKCPADAEMEPDVERKES